MNNFVILVIEDQPFWIDQLPKVLKQGFGEHIEVQVVDDYDEALSRIKEQDYNLISVDLALPDNVEDLSENLPGMILLSDIRNSPRTKDCGLIVLSGRGTVQRVRDALLVFNVHDFLDKLEFTRERYIRAAKASVRTALLQKVSARRGDDYQFSITFNDKSFIRGELTGPDYRSVHQVPSPSIIDFPDLSRRADDLNLRHTPKVEGKWREEARSVGISLYKMLSEQRELREGLIVGRTLAGAQRRRLFLQFSGPPAGLGIPFELMRDAQDYLVFDHIITRRVIEDSPKVKQKSAPFFKFIEQLIKRGETLRVLIIGANSDGTIPDAEEEALELEESLDFALLLLDIPHYIKCLTGPRATCDEVRRALGSNYHIVHYAGHGEHSPIVAEKSPIILSDGVLTASDLKFLLAPTDVRLLFLSCCLGARSASQLGRGDFHGFLHALSQASIPILIGYRWEVFDDSAQLLAMEFYRALFQHFCPGEALLSARQVSASSEYGRDDATWASPVLLTND